LFFQKQAQSVHELDDKNDKEEIEDDVEFEKDINEEKEDDVELKEDIDEEKENDVDFGDDLEEISEEEAGFGEEEFGEEAEEVELENIEKIKVTVEDSEGKTVDIIADDEGITLSTEESSEDMDMISVEDEMLGDEVGDDVEEELEITEIVTDDDLEENPLSSVFTNIEDQFPEEEDVEEECGGLSVGASRKEIKEYAQKTSEFLRTDRIANANSAGGLTLDMDALRNGMGIEKTAQAMPATMPPDTEVEVPRSEEVGIVEDGESVHTNDNENTAKDMSGTAAGSTVYDHKEIERGVEIIEPTAQAASSDDFIVEAQAQATQNEPLDSGEREESNGENLDVPRDESKAKPEIDVKREDVDNPKEVRDGNYGMGPEGKDLHTEVIPRDSSGDGIGGSSVDFDGEKGDKQTSGNPDNYVQEFQKDNQIAPNPVSNEDNHLGASAKDAIRKVAETQEVEENSLEAVEMDEVFVVKDIQSGKMYTVVKEAAEKYEDDDKKDDKKKGNLPPWLDKGKKDDDKDDDKEDDKDDDKKDKKKGNLPPWLKKNKKDSDKENE